MDAALGKLGMRVRKVDCLQVQHLPFMNHS